mmetsp:Transcript_23565/g.41767  ORF Transcript_23565/g.41767 Transcript_23565/m.41767 type:complete len:271 (-) Transcript_23565:26-838(-)
MGASAVNACSNCFNPRDSKEAESLLRRNGYSGNPLALPTPIKFQQKETPQQEATTNTEASSNALIDLAESNSQKFKTLIESIDFSTFENMLDKDGFRVLGKDTADGYQLWSEFSIPFTPLQFIKFVSRSEKRKDWDNNIAESRKLSQLSETVCITYQVYKRFLTIASRDLLIISKTFCEDGVWYDASSSIDSAMMPISKTHVRAKLVLGGYVVKPLINDPKGNLASVISFSDSSIGGSLPKSMVKKMSASAVPKFVSALCLALKRDLASS